jgi:hypothetical protein
MNNAGQSEGMTVTLKRFWDRSIDSDLHHWQHPPRIQILGDSRNYGCVNPMNTFPTISGVILNQFLQRAATQNNTKLIRSWRKWIKYRVVEE